MSRLRMISVKTCEELYHALYSTVVALADLTGNYWQDKAQSGVRNTSSLSPFPNRRAETWNDRTAAKEAQGMTGAIVLAMGARADSSRRAAGCIILADIPSVGEICRQADSTENVECPRPTLGV